MLNEIQILLDKYIAWLKDNTFLRQIDKGVIEITTPYLDRHNDYLQIYVQRDNGDFLLTDDGYTIEDLKMSGCKLDSPKRQNLLKVTLNGFGIQLKEDSLTIQASSNNFALRKHNLMQAMLAVNDLFYLTEPMVSSFFLEDVTAWLDSCEIRYTPKVKFTGKSGYDHLFDFVIPKSKHQPERILKSINHPSRDTAEALAFGWVDTKDIRHPDSRVYAFLNDSEHSPSSAVLEALKNYDVHPIAWSKRENFLEELAA